MTTPAKTPGMNHTTVVPVYWLGGAKVADSYNDFYDGSWDNDTNTKDRTEDGINGLDLTSSGNEPWTGCNDDGTESFSSSNVSQALGKDPATLGRPGTVRSRQQSPEQQHSRKQKY